jgi:hypothetical protein
MTDGSAFCAMTRYVRVALLSALCLALSGCAADVPPVNCNDPDFRCYIEQATRGIVAVRENINYWANMNLFGQAFIVISGIVATIMIALQGDNNKHWTRPIGLIATALVTGVTSALVSLHVPDNVDKLIDSMGKMTLIVNQFDHDQERLVAGRNQQQVAEAFKNDAQFRDAVNDLTTKFSTDYNKVKLDMLRLRGSAARLLANPAPNPPPSSSDK